MPARCAAKQPLQIWWLKVRNFVVGIRKSTVKDSEITSTSLQATVTTTTMAVETQTVSSLNGLANGEVDMDENVKDGTLRFTSGMILPPPEIKCEQLLVLLFSVEK